MGDMTGNNPTDRSKTGTKRPILTDENGIPLSTVITSATNTHDIKAVTKMLLIIRFPIDLLNQLSLRKRQEESIIIYVLIEHTVLHQ